MKKTTNYQLNQWDATDRILREDFNEDNAKIDAAIAENPYVKLREIVTSADAQQIDVDISNVDWNRYRHLLIIVNGCAEDNGTIINSGSIRINNMAGSQDYSYYNYTGTINSASSFGSFCLNFKNEGKYSEVLISGGSSCFHPSCRVENFGELHTQQFICTAVSGDQMKMLNFYVYAGKLLAGLKIMMYGVKI
jgi:hypothetical protein